MCVAKVLSPSPHYTKGWKSCGGAEAVLSKTELSAGTMAPLFTSSRLETVVLKVIIWTSSSSCLIWVDKILCH
jgi:hypothetical protein